MTAQITTLSIKDGAGTDRAVQAVDLSGTGAGPWSFLHGLADASGSPISSANPLAVHNSPLRLRDNFEGTLAGWTVTAGSGDIVQIDGNALGASYLVVSKDPGAAGTDTILESVATFAAPYRAGFGASMSQRVLGQMAAIEVVSTDAPLLPIADVAIASISQAATVVSVTTATAHGFKPGDRVAISGVTANNALNYPQLVVNTVPGATQFTAYAYPGGTIPSLTVGPYTTGTVRRFDHLGYAPDGSSLIFEGATATLGTFAVRAGGVGAMVSGTANGSQLATVATTVSAQLLASTALYTFAPSSLYELFHQLEAIEWCSSGIDNQSSPLSVVHKRTQTVPDPTKTYRVRIRHTNSPSLPRPVAAIVSAVKTGSTVATITTATPHGLATGETVNIYGCRDATNFANLGVAGTITVTDATHFTVSFGTAVTATTYGGVVCRAGGGQVQAGAPGTTVVQSASSDASGVVTVVGSATWSGPVIGDYVNLYGLRSAVDGSSLGLDGAYRIRDGIGGATLTLEPIGSTTPALSVASTNCGGALIKRTDLRVHFTRVAEVTRVVTESAGGTARSDVAAGTPVYPVGTAYVQGGQADQATTNSQGIPAQVQTLSAPPTAGTTGRRSTVQGDLAARPVVRPLGMPQANAFGRATLTTTSETTLLAATAAQRWEIDNVVIANRDSAAHTVDIRDATAGTVRWTAIVASGATLHLPLRGAPSTAVNAAVTATLREAATTGVEVSVNAYATTA